MLTIEKMTESIVKEIDLFLAYLVLTGRTSQFVTSLIVCQVCLDQVMRELREAP
jgi:hypothetical protein